VTLAVRRRGSGSRRRLKISGRIEPSCAAGVVVEVDRRDVRGGHWRPGRRLRARASANGAFSLSARLPRGRYRVRARVGQGCTPALSRRVYFR